MTDGLGTYLQDHLAGSMFGLELVERCRDNNRGTSFEPALETLAREIRTDRQVLTDVLREAGVPPSRLKVSIAWALEKAQRLKPNGGLLRYTPLARVEELESLAMGIAGKRALWSLLDELSASGRPLGARDYSELAGRADAQLRRVEALRIEAGELAFARPSPAPDSARSPSAP